MMGVWVWMICNYKIEQKNDGGDMGKRRRHCGWELQCLSLCLCMHIATEKHEARNQKIWDNPRSLYGAAGKGVESIPFFGYFSVQGKESRARPMGSNSSYHIGGNTFSSSANSAQIYPKYGEHNYGCVPKSVPRYRLSRLRAVISTWI